MDCQQDELVDNGDGMVRMSGIDDVSVAHTLVPCAFSPPRRSYNLV
mgnify:CR=1 FL=1